MDPNGKRNTESKLKLHMVQLLSRRFPKSMTTSDLSCFTKTLLKVHFIHNLYFLLAKRKTF